VNLGPARALWYVPDAELPHEVVTFGENPAHGNLIISMSIVEVRIGQRYKLNNLIGKGLFSEVFEGENVYTGERVAIKLEDLKIRYAQVNFEAQILKHLQGGRNPR
jgi:predicted Ser/Thr protein kinase